MDSLLRSLLSEYLHYTSHSNVKRFNHPGIRGLTFNQWLKLNLYLLRPSQIFDHWLWPFHKQYGAFMMRFKYCLKASRSEKRSERVSLLTVRMHFEGVRIRASVTISWVTELFKSIQILYSSVNKNIYVKISILNY